MRTTFIWYWKKGVAFGYDGDGKVMDINVFRPAGAAPSGFDDALQHEQVLEHAAGLRGYYSKE